MKVSNRIERALITALHELAFFAFSAVMAVVIYAVIQWVVRFPVGSLDWRGVVAVSGVLGLCFQFPARDLFS